MSPQPETVRVLVADDHAVVRDGLRCLIESQPGWRVVGEAATGREAVALAKQLRPHIVVLDFSMPELNGLEATRQIRQALPQTEVLAITVHDSDRLALGLLAAGARGYVLKSDARNHLLAALQALAKHEPYFTPKVRQLILDQFLESTVRACEESPSMDRLTAREREVLQLVAEGRSTKEIAARLGLSSKTIEVHRANLMAKLNLHSVADVVRHAIRNEIIEP